MHFRHRIKAIWRPSTNANLCYLKFDLTNCSWEKNCQNCKIRATRSVEVSKWPQHNPLRYLFQFKGWKSPLSPSFVTFSEREPFLRGFFCWYFWCFWSQRCIGVSKRWWKKKISTGSQFDHFPLKFCEHTLSNLLPPAQAFSNPATRWRSSMPDPCKTMLIQTWTKVLKDCITSIYIFKQSWYV